MPEYPVFGDVLQEKNQESGESSVPRKLSWRDVEFTHQLPPAARACPLALLCLPKSSSERACFVVSLLLAARQAAWLSTVVLRSISGVQIQAQQVCPWPFSSSDHWVTWGLGRRGEHHCQLPSFIDEKLRHGEGSGSLGLTPVVSGRLTTQMLIFKTFAFWPFTPFYPVGAPFFYKGILP